MDGLGPSAPRTCTKFNYWCVAKCAAVPALAEVEVVLLRRREALIKSALPTPKGAPAYLLGTTPARLVHWPTTDLSRPRYYPFPRAGSCRRLICLPFVASSSAVTNRVIRGECCACESTTYYVLYHQIADLPPAFSLFQVSERAHHTRFGRSFICTNVKKFHVDNWRQNFSLSSCWCAADFALRLPRPPT